MMSKQFIQRKPASHNDNLPQVLHPVIKRVLLNRGVDDAKYLEKDLHHLLPYHKLLNADKAAALIYKHLSAQNKILVIGDFDADGATSSALAVTALKKFGALNAEFLVPNRFEYGYGLTPEIVEAAYTMKPQLIITVDNGIANIKGVERAKALGIEVLITDHHLPADCLPEADVIVNPNQPGDTFPSKSLAGVGVIFYVMLALRQHLRDQHWFTEKDIHEPNMAELLDLVALGTVADVAMLDYNNRILVHQGLGRMRHAPRPGIKALAVIANRKIEKIVAQDLAYGLAPRLNAAGRLDDMTLGIQCLLSTDESSAMQQAQTLENLNLERREIENKMQNEALALLDRIHFNEASLPAALCVFEKSWHQGVIGILASRLKERYYRPVVVFARGEDGILKGSGRCIDGVHLRDVLDLIDKRYPHLIIKFGGHSMAAGVSIHEKNYSQFIYALNEVMKEVMDESALTCNVYTDGPIISSEVNLPLAKLIAAHGPWGQGFPEPLFIGKFMIIEQRLIGSKHIKFSLRFNNDDKIIPAILFNADLNAWPNTRIQSFDATYHLNVNEYNGFENLQLILQDIVMIYEEARMLTF